MLEPVEWAHGRIEGAIHVRLMELPQRLGELPARQTLAVCEAGGRSAGRRLPRAAGGRVARRIELRLARRGVASLSRQQTNRAKPAVPDRHESCR
ncbi:rhodanese-like domain-containing protein [Nocardioides sp. S5]|uniref:rhodanese-like domain-containing protein n=1 Tax=Nocardioides sp. S5 TaxID=2017486 RepID=UPI001F5CE8C9|nr:rhodanese-like domain-containing protein [Nocardioides sp. S5]